MSNKSSLKNKMRWQRASDLVGLAILSPLLLPVTACVMAVAWYDCGIPPFYIQKRIGYAGEEFNIVKARTMQDLDKLDPTSALKEFYEGLDADDKAFFDDAFRISKIGRFLRITRLDELPQIFNIAVGTMSFVGPRPHKIEDSINTEYPARHNHRPGLTGLGKVSGMNSISHDEEGIKDTEYDSIVHSRSALFLQFYRLSIIFATPLALLNHRDSSDAYMHDKTNNNKVFSISESLEISREKNSAPKEYPPIKLAA